jgi:hypothetical protein
MSAIDARKATIYNGDSALNAPQISPKVVTTHWDSTLNSTYDGSCAVNIATPMTPSERACALSHVSIWKYIMNCDSGGGNSSSTITDSISYAISQIPSICINHNRLTQSNVNELLIPITLDNYSLSNCSPYRSDVFDIAKKSYLIFEDDAEIIEFNTNITFQTQLHEVLKKLPSNYDVCYLGYAAPKKAIQHAKSKLLFQPKYLWQLHCYILSTSGAMKLLSYLPINAPVDNYIARLITEDRLNVSSYSICYYSIFLLIIELKCLLVLILVAFTSI